MSDREQKVEEKNLEAAVAFLKEETRKAGENLSGLLQECAAAEKARDEALREAADARATLDALRADQEAERLKTEQHRAAREEITGSHEVQVESLRKEAKHLLEELGRLNSWITASADEKARKEAELRSLDLAIAEHNRTLAYVDQLNDECRELEARRDVLRSENTATTADIGRKLEEFQKQLATFTEAAATAKQAASESENRKTTFDHEYLVKKEDLETLIGRVAEVWTTTFPDKRFPF